MNDEIPPAKTYIGAVKGVYCGSMLFLTDCGWTFVGGSLMGYWKISNTFDIYDSRFEVPTQSGAVK